LMQNGNNVDVDLLLMWSTTWMLEYAL